MELPNTHAHTYGIHTHRHTHKKRKKERKKEKRKNKERGRGMGFRGLEERGYWGGQDLILITLDRHECFSVFHHLQKDKQRKQRHSLKLGKKRRESSKRNYYIISPRVIIKAIIIICLRVSLHAYIVINICIHKPEYMYMHVLPYKYLSVYKHRCVSTLLVRFTLIYLCIGKLRRINQRGTFLFGAVSAARFMYRETPRKYRRIK